MVTAGLHVHDAEPIEPGTGSFVLLANAGGLCLIIKANRNFAIDVAALRVVTQGPAMGAAVWLDGRSGLFEHSLRFCIPVTGAKIVSNAARTLDGDRQEVRLLRLVVVSEFVAL